jgi:hypothetical protein
VHLAAKLVVLFASALVAANAQCAVDCALEQCGPARAPQTHCHHEGMPDKEPAKPACPYPISIVDNNTNQFTVVPVPAFVPDLVFVAPIATPGRARYGSVENDISPPVPLRASLSVLRI